MFQVLFFPRPIPNTALNREIQLKGHIESLRYQGLRSQSFIFVIRQLNKQPLYSRVILTDYQKKITVKAGMELELTAKLKPFAVFHNDGGRDWLKQMYFKRLFAKGYLIHIEKPLGTKRAPFIKRLREYCLRRIQILSMAKESQGLVESLTLGVRHNLSNAWREVFRATGTGHLIAISGLHVGLFAYAAYKLFFFLWCLSARLCERVPAQRAAAVAAIIFAFFYVALTNFSVSALRAFIMIALVMVAKIIGRRPYLWDIFFTALVLVLFINPYSIYNYGFYLSFYAVFIIFSFVGDGEIKLVKLQFIISLLMLPISLYFFSYASLSSIPANIVAIPVVSFGVLPLAIFTMLTSLSNLALANHLSWLFATLAHTLLTYLSWLKTLRFLTLPFVVSTLSQFLLLTSVMWVALKFPRKAVLLILLPVLFPLCFYSPKLQAGDLNFSVLDIGQGLNVVLQTRDHTLIYDTGMRYPSGFSLARIVTLPFLHYHGITKLDSIVISHEDNDHVGGLETLLESYPVAEVITNDRKQTNHCHQHRAWNWDGVHFSFIKLPEIDSSDNNNSCILKVRVGNKSILLTGDIEKKAEDYLVRYKSQQLTADLLLAPHHGSNTSSTSEFIDAVNPDYVIISAGRMNRFSHPHSKVVMRYLAKGCDIYNTAKNGQISWLLEQHGSLKPPVTRLNKHVYS